MYPVNLIISRSDFEDKYQDEVNIVVPFLRMALNPELMLFQPPVVNEGIEYLQWIECRPVNQITEDGSIDIHVKASGSQYLDLQRSHLYVKAKIVRGWWKFGSC